MPDTDEGVGAAGRVYKLLWCRVQYEGPDSWAGGSELQQVHRGDRARNADDSWVFAADHLESMCRGVYCALESKRRQQSFSLPLSLFLCFSPSACHFLQSFDWMQVWNIIIHPQQWRCEQRPAKDIIWRDEGSQDLCTPMTCFYILLQWAPRAVIPDTDDDVLLQYWMWCVAKRTLKLPYCKAVKCYLVSFLLL